MTKLIKPTIRIHNTETNEVIDREMTDDEFAKYEANIETSKIRQAQADAKEAAKAAILERIGLTADELKTILG